MESKSRSSGSALRTLVAMVLGTGWVEAQELFRLVVDPAGPTPFYDATGRHGITIGGVADVDPGPAIVPGGVIATNMLAPDGSRGALLTGGWLEITTSNPSYSSDFLFAADQNLTVTFWFKSAGNGVYDPSSRYPDRMHALGLGSTANNLDVDFGDQDNPIANVSETACWTYYGCDFFCGGETQVFDSIDNRNHYFDGGWHRYTLVRDSGTVTAYLDQRVLGSAAYSGPLGADSSVAGNFLGRASLRTHAGLGGDPFPWFGYIAGARVFDHALPPDTTPPALSCPPYVSAVDRLFTGPGEVVQYSVTATDNIDPAPVVVCMPPSGSLFPRGTTMVTCTATDVSGNQSVCTFPVVVSSKLRPR